MRWADLQWICVLILATSGWALAQNDPTATTKFHGTATDWPNEVIRLIAWGDPISRSETIVALDTIAEDGAFSLSAPLSGPKRYFLGVRRFRAPVFAEPGQSYHIIIPPDPLHALMRSWQPGEFEYFFIDLPRKDLNAHISVFDSLYFDFYLGHMEQVGTSGIRPAVSSFEKNILAADEAGEFGDIPMMDTYIAYSLAKMKLNAGFPKRDIFKEYLQHQPIKLDNPAWFEFFDLFYADFFESYELRFGGENLSNRLRKGLSPQALDSLMRNDDFLHGDSLRRLVMLKSALESFYSKNFPKAPLVDVTEFVYQTAEDPQTREIAKRILNRMNRGRPELKPMMGDVGLDSPVLDTSRAVVVVISAPWSKSSQKETSTLHSLVERYGDYFDVVEISIDGNNPSATWPIAVPKDTYAFLEKYRIYSIPTFYYRAPGENDELQAIQIPGEGLESLLYALQVKREQRSRIKVGQ